jgi:hypothetical protein
VRWTLLLAFVLPWSAPHAATIYLCRTYSDGYFWASDHCRAHNALIDRMVSVPDGLPWNQQVNLGEQDRQRGAKLAAPPAQPQVVQQVQQGGVDKRAQCAALDAEATSIDAAARQPQSGQGQDILSQRKRAVRDRQAQLRC